MLAMGVPLLDTFLAMWRRLVRHLLDGKGGKSTGIFTADREHLHDRLRATGLSQRRAALALYILAALLMLAGLLATAYSSHRTGILMAAFALFSYIVIRHLARVELWDSGRLVVNGLQRPTTKVMAVIFYPFADTIILALSFALIVRLAGTTTGNESFKELWRALAPMGIAVPFIGIVCSGAYHRVWSRASAAEYGWLMICLVGAIALTGTLLDFGNGITLHSILLVQLLYTGSALPWIMLVRIFPRLVQSSMLSLNRHRTASRNACATLLCGAGYDATLFLRQHGYRGESAYETFRILGFIDNDSNLRGRIVHGHRVLGNIADLEQLADKLDIKCVIITTSLPDDEMQKLKKTAGRHSIRLMLWQHTMTTIQE
jgi:UDP-GlcNAc:undecaprenyl-phosphate GlcNAc-1-phosphate transferase